MTEIINAGGSVTYSADVRQPIEIGGLGNVYEVRGGLGTNCGETYIVEDAAQAEAMRSNAAELIAIADAYDRRQDQQAQAARDRLAELLYLVEQADTDGPPPAWQDALPATRRRLENKADQLRILGVTAGA